MNSEFTIFGSGIAGLITAWQLKRRGFNVTVVDPNPNSGASCVPVALMNPVYGTRAKFVDEYDVALDVLGRITGDIPGCLQFIHPGILRLANEPDLLDRYKISYLENNLSERGYKWTDTDEISTMIETPNPLGGIFISDGYRILLPSFLNEIKKYLKKNHVDFKTHSSNKNKITTQVIMAIGSAFLHHPDWNFVSCHHIKGQTISLGKTPDLFLKTGVSASGYASPLNESEILVGSTFEHIFTDEQIDDAGRAYLLKKATSLFGKVRMEVMSQWSGVRLATRDRKPFVGRHPEITNYYAIGGFGSKGLIQSFILSEYLQNHICEGQSIPSTVDVQRFLKIAR